MGASLENPCASSRRDDERLDYKFRETSYYCKQYTQQAKEHICETKNQLRDKYYEKKFRLMKEQTRSSLIYSSSMLGGTEPQKEFQLALLDFEKCLPLANVKITEFDRRVKKLVYCENYINGN